MIDRFDVRSHLDIIDEYALKHQQNHQESESVVFHRFSSVLNVETKHVFLLFFCCFLRRRRNLNEKESNEELLCNYERYRVLIHNEATGGEFEKRPLKNEFSFLVNEEQCLRDIENDEKFGALKDEHHPAIREAKKKK